MNPGIETVVDYLASVPAWYLATSQGEQPHVRPFSFAAGLNDRIWFCTGKHKDVYVELQINPKFEASAWKPGHGWLVLRGEADFSQSVNDLIRRAGFAHMRSLGESYDGVEDPKLVFFSVRDPKAWIRDIDGSETEIDFTPEKPYDPFADPAPEPEEPAEAEAEAEAEVESSEIIEETDPSPEASTYIVESSNEDLLTQPEAFVTKNERAAEVEEAPASKEE